MSFKDLIDSAKHLVVEDDPTAKPAPAPALHPHPAFNLPPNFSAAAPAPAMSSPHSSPFSVPTATVVDENVYQSILKKTSFDDTPVGKAVKKYYDALEGIITDETQRFKAAIGQAQKLDNYGPEQVLQTFDQLAAALDNDARGFQGVADSVEKNQITAVQTEIATLDQQIADLTNRRSAKAADLQNNQVSHASAVSQYGLANSRRAQEIAAQKAQVASLLH